MGTDVSLQIGVDDKLLRAEGAFVVFACRVRTKVELKVGGVCKAFTAVCALKRSLARMRPFMLFQI